MHTQCPVQAPQIRQVSNHLLLVQLEWVEGVTKYLKLLSWEIGVYLKYLFWHFDSNNSNSKLVLKRQMIKALQGFVCHYIVALGKYKKGITYGINHFLIM